MPRKRSNNRAEFVNLAGPTYLELLSAQRRKSQGRERIASALIALGVARSRRVAIRLGRPPNQQVISFSCGRRLTGYVSAASPAASLQLSGAC
jgi:hypothetical protein